MSFDRFSLSFPVAAPAAKIYAHLMIPENYVGLSPLVVEVRNVHPTADGTAYTAVERFRFGPFKWDNLIKVVLIGSRPDAQVVSKVKSPGWVTLLATVDLVPEPDSDRTQVTETVELTTPWFLRSFALGQARSVQKERAAELARRFESAA